MNAIEFIQKHGVNRAKECLPSYEKHYCGIEQLFVEDLKRLVESVDLVKEHYTLDRVIEYTSSAYTAPEIKERLEQAIADYEAIYSGEQYV